VLSSQRSENFLLSFGRASEGLKCANQCADFEIKRLPAAFIFETEDGTISGWNPNVDPTHAVIKVNEKGKYVFKGATIATANVAFVGPQSCLPEIAQHASPAGGRGEPHAAMRAFDSLRLKRIDLRHHYPLRIGSRVGPRSHSVEPM
jgi:hypothetical protein